MVQSPERAELRVKCPHCGCSYRLVNPGASLAKLQLRCKQCRGVFRPAEQVAPEGAAVAPPEEVREGAEGVEALEELEKHLGKIGRRLDSLRRASRGEGPPEEVFSDLRALGGALAEMGRRWKGMRRKERELETLLEVSQAMSSELDLERLLHLIMDLAIRVMGAERGFLMLKNPETGELRARVARNMEEALAGEETQKLSSTITSRVASEGTYLLTTDAQADARFQDAASVMGYNLRSILCVPLRRQEDVLGVLYLDNRMATGTFTEEGAGLCASFAGHAAVAIENARLLESIQEETRRRTNLQRYLSPAVVEDVIAKKEELVLGGESLECTVLFSDICGFTPFSERLEPPELVHLLNEYFTLIADIIFAHNGTLDKYIGDATMAIFGAPVFDPESALNAVSAGLAMQEACKKLQERWASEGKPTFQMRVGINTGPVVAGNMGSPRRMDYTVMGDAVNLAQRLESKSEPGGVLISEDTYERVRAYAKVRELGEVSLKGKSRPVRVFAVDSIQPPVREKPQIQRRHPRSGEMLYAIYKQEGETRTRQGVIRNLGAGGLQLSTGFLAKVGQALSLEFTLPKAGRLQGIPGRVVAARQEAGEGSRPSFRVCIEFTGIDEDARRKVAEYVSARLAANA